MNYACEAAIGAVSGLRSLTGPAIIAGAANRDILKLKRTPLAWLASEGSARTTILLAAGELIADKLPFMPNRTALPGLVARFISGAICGVAIGGRLKGNERIMSGIGLSPVDHLLQPDSVLGGIAQHGNGEFRHQAGRVLQQRVLPEIGDGKSDDFIQGLGFDLRRMLRFVGIQEAHAATGHEQEPSPNAHTRLSRATRCQKLPRSFMGRPRSTTGFSRRTRTNCLTLTMLRQVRNW